MKKNVLMMMVMVVIAATMVFAEEWVLPEVNQGEVHNIKMYYNTGYVLMYESFEKNDEGETLYVLRIGSADLDYYITFLDTLSNAQAIGQSLVLTSMFGNGYDIYTTVQKWKEGLPSFTYIGSASGKKWTCYASENYIEALGKINPKVLDQQKKTNSIE